MLRPATPADPPAHSAVLPGGGTFSYTCEGEGPTILAVHGHPGSVRDWRWLAPTLTDAYRLIRVDLPGHGQTPAMPRFGHAPSEKARFIVEVIASLNLSRCTLLGHSFGGAVCISAAHQAPEPVAALALVASVGSRPHRAIRSHKNLDVLLQLLRWPITRLLLRPILRWSIIKAGFPRATTGEETALAIEAVGAIDFESQRSTLDALRCPTLVAWACDDHLIESAIFEELSTLSPKGHRIAFETGGHNIQKTQANALGAALGDWLNGALDHPDPNTADPLVLKQ